MKNFLFNNLMIGADPEVFFEKNNKIISAEGLVGGTKEEPLKISDEGHFIQEDNIMAEFNIPPCNNKDEFIENINFAKYYLEIISNKNGATLSNKVSDNIDKKYLNSKQSNIFGCDPDYNVYNKTVNDPIKSINGFRSCGGHIHLGWNIDDINSKKYIESCENIIKAMDLTLGIESVLLDDDTKRRSTYGKAGNFRFKDYGVEYRTLSNFWIQNDKFIKWAFDKTLLAVYIVENNLIQKLSKKYSKKVEKIINNSLKEEAVLIVNEITKELKINKNDKYFINNINN